MRGSPRLGLGRWLIIIAALSPALAATKPPFVPRRLYLDWVALNCKATTRHIMRPPTAAGREECLALKTELVAAQQAGVRSSHQTSFVLFCFFHEMRDSQAFIVDAFGELAAQQSIDEESRGDGGIIGRRLRQGVCREPELDRACFCSPLGRVTGPVQTTSGYHLVLVEERASFPEASEASPAMRAARIEQAHCTRALRAHALSESRVGRHRSEDPRRRHEPCGGGAARER